MSVIGDENRQKASERATASVAVVAKPYISICNNTSQGEVVLLLLLLLQNPMFFFATTATYI